MSLQNDTEVASAPDGEDSIEVVQQVSRPLGEIWSLLTRTEGVEALLGEGATLGDKGDPWRAADGTCGVTRSYHPEQQIRVSWHADPDSPPTLVDLQMEPEGEGTLLVLRHEHLDASADREALRRRWDEALHRLTSI
ncbi:SRPBCC family protein [Mobilicoccus massiliensis]|uniref:SRPBCC family protein n=1 Tax=Mobilicoccus massiliensis TaxID=1522310 RepID=UPI00058E0796|nr:SRPBCC domain-containing protein [Mobilicoccus massiliensis]